MAAFTVNEDGVKRLYTVSTANNTIRKLKVPLGQIYNLRFSDDNRQIAFTIGSAKNPGDVYAYTISSGSLKRWTFSETGGLPADSFVEPQLVHYTPFDSVNGTPRLIPAFLYKPHGASAVNQTGTFPVLIQIHGGPETQYVPSFSPVIQYFVRELGIAVIAPNVRGSSGYGKTFLTLDNGYKRQDAVKDIGRLLDWIGKQPDLDSGRVAVMGKSYGGFMTFASMAAYNSRLRCGISTAGISSFVTFLNNTAEHRRDARRVEYGDERDAKMRAFFETVSPLSNAGRITKPLFIAQGSNDPRVPVSEARQMQKAIQKNGAPVWFMLAPDEGHGFAKKSNSDYFTSAVSMFLRKYLFAAFDHVK